MRVRDLIHGEIHNSLIKYAESRDECNYDYNTVEEFTEMVLTEFNKLLDAGELGVLQDNVKKAREALENYRLSHSKQ
uniref:Uncharacterized protein n=1 Tax=viral metagenome TaxID=1070528 RepID=A0A6M3IHE7_9ZZZZ